MSAPTLRSLAQYLGVSCATVSSALNGSGRVKPATARRIVQAAKAAGYQKNPLASAVMSEFRKSRGREFHGVLAVVDMYEVDRPAHSIRYHHDLIDGVMNSAARLGFKAETFVVGRAGLTIERLDGILRARGIHGMVLLPSWHSPDISKLDWSRYVGVYTDYIFERPGLHSVYPDHYRAMMMALQRLHGLGYRRPGMHIMRQTDERIQYRWEGAFLAFQANWPDADPLPRLKMATLDEGEFRDWFRTYQPDVVLGHRTEVIDWMRKEGADFPTGHAFVCLNALRQTVPCAALDLQPKIVGSLALEHLVAQLHRNEFGIPQVSSATSVPPRWVDGPTVRSVEDLVEVHFNC